MTIPILSTATISQTQVMRYVNARPTLPDSALIVDAYYTIAHKEYGLNVPAVIAQAIHETSCFTSDIATKWFNFCGLGVTDGQWRRGWAFPTIELGVHAHCAHLLGYTATPHNTLCQVADPRHFAHNSKLTTIADFIGSGWSASSATYGDAIQTIYDAIAQA